MPPATNKVANPFWAAPLISVGKPSPTTSICVRESPGSATDGHLRIDWWRWLVRIGDFAAKFCVKRRDRSGTDRNMWTAFQDQIRVAADHFNRFIQGAERQVQFRVPTANPRVPASGRSDTSERCCVLLITTWRHRLMSLQHEMRRARNAWMSQLRMYDLV